MSSPMLVKAEELQILLLSEATGESADPSRYRELREELRQDGRARDLLPRFVTTCRELGQFWTFIKSELPTYAERRQYIRDGFASLLKFLEDGGGAPSDGPIGDYIRALDAAEITRVWEKALDRRSSDPDGALTAARTLLETVIKWILEEKGVDYDAKTELPDLYKKLRDTLSLSPGGELDNVVNQVLGGCISVVQGLGALRNRLGDAHGKGRSAFVADAKYAELAVNLAGSMSLFLATVWTETKG